jgi:hypothetical protein
MTCSHKQPHFSTCSSVFIVTRWKVFCCLPHVPFFLKTSLYGICLLNLTWQIEGFDGSFVKFDKKFKCLLDIQSVYWAQLLQVKSNFHTGHLIVFVYVTCILYFLKVAWKGQEPINCIFSECSQYCPIALLFMFHLL